MSARSSSLRWNVDRLRANPHLHLELGRASGLSGQGLAGAAYERGPFKFRHDFSVDPWFSTDRLLALAAALPSASVEYNPGDLPVNQPGSSIPGNGLSLAETIRDIDRCASWVLLKSVAQHPDYAELQRLCLAEIARQLDLRSEELLAPRSFVFLASPGAVTPFHIDPEHNFLLQIGGGKEIQIFDHFDRTVLTGAQLRDFVAGAHRNISFEDAFAERGEWFQFGPGEGVYIPFLAPHWVRNGASVSISYSLSFETAKTKGMLASYRADHATVDAETVSTNLGEPA